MIETERDAAATHTLSELLTPYGIYRLGVVRYATSGHRNQETRVLRLSDETVCTLGHDEREAPYAIGRQGLPDDGTLVSLSDECGLKVCAWAKVPHDTRVRGIGVDLASVVDFAGERGRTFNHLMFTESEQAWAQERTTETLELSYAFAFSAKEAAFKSLAAPLRTWYQSHADELAFEVRDFELAGGLLESGTARRGAADRAMRAMGIERIELARMVLDGMALTFAVALS